MSILYDIAFMSAGFAPLSIRHIDARELSSTALFAAIVKDAGPDWIDGETSADRAKREQAWLASRVAAATEDEVRALLDEATHGGALISCSPEDVLAIMREPGANVWERCLPGADEASLRAGADLLWVQLLLAEGLPHRFAYPTWVHEVALIIYAAHPDVGDFPVNHSMAARLLMDAEEQHPLKRYWPAYSERIEGVMNLVFAVELRDVVELPDPSDQGDIYYEKECHIWLPAHLTGNLSEKKAWDSAAFCDG